MKKTWPIQMICFFASFVVLFIYLLCPQKVNLLLLCAVLTWVNNILYALSRFKRRVIFFFFNITFFTFILGRPVLDWVQGNDWVLMPIFFYYKDADAKTAMIVIIVSLYAIWLGAVLGNRCLLRMHYKIIGKRSFTAHKGYVKMVRKLSLLLLAVSLVASYISGLDKIAFMASHSYVEYYTMYQSKLPYLVYALSTFLGMAICVYLATMPRKRDAFAALVLYVLSTIPDLIVGARGPVVKAILLSLIYYILRDFYAGTRTWVGKFEKMALIVGVPSGVVFLGIYNYIRDGVSVAQFNPVSAVMDFFYRQGVTFAWLSSGLGAVNLLPNAANPHYSLGGLIDYFQYGKLGQLITGLPGLASGNNILRATRGNSMAHHISYILLGDSYLQGYGCGTSYLLETFVDGGIGGVLVYSFLLGFLLIFIVEAARHGLLVLSMVLCSIQGILGLPRGEAISCLQFMYRVPFWCVILFCFIGARLLVKKYLGQDTASARPLGDLIPQE